jgi:hypothetical protein
MRRLLDPEGLVCSKWVVARRGEGAYLDRYVTDEQRSSRPIFDAMLGPAASWLFFRVARSTVVIKNSQLTCGEIQGIQEMVH